ncbi:hypothetical protein JX265_013747 [Neoarthrinium moseri]|uniref:Zn(2)-C6 fungal-type domain-containing protein n=1 Tax=Neoarthrinium moseri TaxID=1658444 RepID=A0A9P9W809_9PEZI|nr:uncharacterized protein JN550_013613 [Neoarthrinium moseri]KAI1848780.1 hypothetical protein JX265_013747 [Neoarthrinium moseri]KAI1856906.1 hypothetical protein JN550_013613 [Neoarthrinium moseri]
MKRRASNPDDDHPEVQQPPTAPKRQRVSRACDQCRAAREKCDGIQPLCFPCASQNRQCSWKEPKKKRGVQTGYIRTLELSLGWIFDKIPGSEEALHGLLTHEGGQGRALLVGKDTSAGNRLHRRWRKSTVHQEIDRVLSGGDATSSKADSAAPAADESDSGDESEQVTKQEPITGRGPSLTLGHPPVDTPSHGDYDSSVSKEESRPLGTLYRPASNTYTPSQGTQQTLKLPWNCWRLLDIYFSYTHCWFPILEKALVHKTCWSYPSEGLAPVTSVPVSASYAELWAALAVSAHQEEAGHHDGSTHGEAETRMSPDEIYQVARSLIPPENGEFETRHVNAILLLALVKIGRKELTAAWILVGLATRVALDLGLQSRSVAEGSRRPQHSYMACFILDTLVSARIQRPPHLRADDTPPAIASGEDDQDEWDIWAPCAGFGTLRSQTTLSRSPAHSMSSFSALYGIHRVHSKLVFGRQPDGQGEEPYLSQVQRSLGSTARRPFNTYIVNGGVPPGQVPSVHLLRLAFLCCASQAQVFTDSLPASVLQCVEEHLLNFGSAIPPLFSIYLDLLRQQYNLELVKDETRDRWKKVDTVIDAVWASPAIKSLIIHKPPDRTASFPQPASNVLFHGTTNVPTVVQQVPTPSSHYDTPGDQAPSIINGDIFHNAAVPGMLNFPSSTRAGQPMGILNNLGTPTTSQFNLADMPPQNYSAHARPSFGSVTFDYDSILDDIASLDRADRMGSDPQFMANLGFAPGSDLTDLLAHEYSGMP